MLRVLVLLTAGLLVALPGCDGRVLSVADEVPSDTPGDPTGGETIPEPEEPPQPPEPPEDPEPPEQPEPPGSPDGGTTDPEGPVVPPTPTTSSKRIAIILFSTKGGEAPEVTEAQARSLVFTHARSVNAYFKEASFGKWELVGRDREDGDVYGPYTIDAEDTGRCDWSLWASQAAVRAAEDGYLPSDYSVQLFAFRTSSGGCPGRAWASGRQSFVVRGFNVATVTHELGHSFGLNHAGTWRCKNADGEPATIGPTCSSDEYGDFAVMGATTLFHMNGFHKAALGWLEPGNVLDVTRSGTHTLLPLETKTAGVQVIRVLRTPATASTPADYYYLEFRQSFGFDAFAATDPRVKGVLIRVSAHSSRSGHKPKLLDATRPGITDFGDAALPVGATFTDAERGISIRTISVGAAGAQVEIRLP